MDFNINIQKLGKINDVFEFYKYFDKANPSKNHALLESVEESSHEMLFTFIAINPDFMVKVIGDKLKYYDILSETGEKIKEFGESNEFKNDSNYKMPFEDEVPMDFRGLEELKKIFPMSKSAMPELFPRKIFSGGLLGYVGYDIVAPFVGYKPSAEMTEKFPDIVMGLFTNVLTYSHSTNTLYQITNNIGSHKPDLNTIKIFEKFKTENGHKKVKSYNIDKREILSQKTDFKSNTSLEQWTDMIEKTKEHIFSGDIIQSVISRKMITESDLDPLHIYQALRILNPSPYMYFINFEGAHNGDIRIIGSSPEALITKSQSHLETVPIAGTRRRGRNPEDEMKMEYEILHSEKELAEHIMLVDLARNDLARVSEPGTVDTYELIKLRKFPNVMHLISKVRSTSYLDPFAILKSMFPAGTVSGAPKKRAMEIIQNIELENRGPYSGCVGYISFTGDMDMPISIRTIFNKNKTYIAQAGAGIVADSIPKEEYLETANKLQGVLSTINLAKILEEKEI
ncbi:MAG: anthranilate synthase component I family protein [archaeon]|nr:anthranilate synthase component I family protein [archaeon]